MDNDEEVIEAAFAPHWYPAPGRKFRGVAVDWSAEGGAFGIIAKLPTRCLQSNPPQDPIEVPIGEPFLAHIPLYALKEFIGLPIELVVLPDGEFEVTPAD